MSGDGTSFTIDIPVTGASKLDAASASADVLANKLDVASKATLAASNAVKAANDSFAASEAKADKLAKAVERIGMTAEAQRGKLRVALDVGDSSGAERAAAQLRYLADREKELTSKAEAAKASLLTEAAALDKLKLAATAAEAEEKKLQDAHKKPAAEKAGDGGGFNLERLDRGLGKIGGPLGDVGHKVVDLFSGANKLAQSFGGMDAEAAAATGGLSLLAAALAAVTVAAVAGVLKITEWAIGLADANRSALLLSEGIARSVSGGAALNSQVNSLVTKLPLTREEVSSLAKSLSDSGLRGNDLSTALDRSATAAARLKFGPDFAKEMLSLNEQSKVFHANLAATFGGLRTDGLMGALQKMVALFDSSTASGRAMKVVFESLFQPMIDKVTEAGPAVERFFIQLEILAMKGLIAIKPYGSVIAKAGEALLLGAAVIGGVLAVAVVGFIASLVEFAIEIGALAYATEKWVETWIDGIMAVKAWFSTFNLADVGKAMVDGLVAGIENGGAAVLASMTGVVDKAVKATKKLLGIASPSKVYADIGEQTGEGMAIGVDRSSPRVQSSLESMSSPPDTATAAPSGRSAPDAAPASAGVSLSNVTFQFNGVEGAKDAEWRFREMYLRMLEGDAIQFGAMSPQKT